jgi:hypothetical protein
MENENEQLLEQEVELDAQMLQDLTSIDEAVAKKVQTLSAQKNHFRDKFQKEAEKNKKLAEELEGLKEKPVDAKEEKPSAPIIDTDAIETRAVLRVKGYTPEEIRTMESYAKGSGKKLSEVVDDPFVKAGIDNLRSAAKSEQATPPSSSGSTTHKEKSWAEMTPEERKTNFESYNTAKKKAMGNE